MELILSYFPEMDLQQQQQMAGLDRLYKDWNEKINVISRKDIHHLYEHHILHSLALAKFNPFKDGMSVIDIGTGGGFPGIPLAIMFPEVRFTLLDSTAKKIHVINEIAAALGLKNVKGVHARAEEYQGQYDLIISRAVASLKQTIDWTKKLTEKDRWIFLKGGDQKELKKELLPVFKIAFVAISDYFSEEYFREKWIVDVRKK